MTDYALIFPFIMYNNLIIMRASIIFLPDGVRPPCLCFEFCLYFSLLFSVLVLCLSMGKEDECCGLVRSLALHYSFQQTILTCELNFSQRTIWRDNPNPSLRIASCNNLFIVPPIVCMSQNNKLLV